MPSYFDHLREACVVDGYDSVIRQGPLNEAKLIIVGEQPMISLYRLNKVNWNIALVQALCRIFPGGGGGNGEIPWGMGHYDIH